MIARFCAKYLSRRARKARQQRKAIRETTNAMRAHLIKAGKLRA
jgi:hypothetical protein